jgi:Protein of unknown function (DUF1579)
MKRKVSLAAVVLTILATTAIAQQDQKESKPSMDPAMMDAMMKAGTPGPEHQKLDGMVGTWQTKVTMWSVPGADPMVMEGTSDNQWVLGGRYLEQRFSGSFAGMPFEGRGYTGYDNVKKQYWGTWMDNMSTSIMLSTGSVGDDGKTWTFTGTAPDPMTGKDQTVTSKMTVIDADHHTMEMWGPGPDGKTFKSMEIAYSRKK